MAIKIKRFGTYSREYLDAMHLLVSNLPLREMRVLASRLIDNPNTPRRTWGCLDNQVPIGALVGGPLNSETSYLEFIWLKPEYRKEGVGSRLLNSFEEFQRKIGIRRIEAESYEEMTLRWAQKQGYGIDILQGRVTGLSKNIQNS